MMLDKIPMVKQKSKNKRFFLLSGIVFVFVCERVCVRNFQILLNLVFQNLKKNYFAHRFFLKGQFFFQFIQAAFGYSQPFFEQSFQF